MCILALRPHICYKLNRVVSNFVDLSISANTVRIFLEFQIVQEYERAVIFRLGRVTAGGAKGPGGLFIAVQSKYLHMHLYIWYNVYLT